jgi:hypothetical protein
MADISVEKKQGADLNWLWALVAVLAVVGLMFWLATNQQTSTQVLTGADNGTGVAADPASTAEVVDLSLLSADPAPYTGRQVRVADVTVAAVLGERAFWADVPGANPFLVVLGAEVSETGWVQGGATVNTLEGTIQTVDEAVLDQWVQGQVIRPVARDEASFASHYLNATQVVR